MSKQRKLYQVREWVGTEYSKQLGFKLRCRESSMKLVKHMKLSGRHVFASPVMVAQKG